MWLQAPAYTMCSRDGAGVLEEGGSSLAMVGFGLSCSAAVTVILLLAVAALRYSAFIDMTFHGFHTDKMPSPFFLIFNKYFNVFKYI